MSKRAGEPGPLAFFDIQGAVPERVASTRRDFQAELQRLLEAQGAEAMRAAELATELWDHMTSANRHYHTPVHVLLVLGQARRLALELPARCSLAIWFHDIIYDARATGGRNETASAEWVEARLPGAGVPRQLARQAAESIRWTARLLELDVPAEHALVLDLDLAGLARERESFELQSLAVRQEQRHLSDEEYRRANLGLFEALLARPSIYRTAEFAPLEAAAHANLQEACERLRK